MPSGANNPLIGLLQVLAASTGLVAITWSTIVKNLQVSLEESLHKRFKRVAADRGETLANLVREAVTAFVAAQEQREAELKEEDR